MKRIGFVVLFVSIFIICAFTFFKTNVYEEDYNFNLDVDEISFDSNKFYLNDNLSLSASTGKEKEIGSKVKEETVKINISDELYNNYRGVGDVDHTVSLKPVKVAAYNGIISFRYVNNLYTAIDSMDMALDFRLELERSGYRVIIDSEKKKIYEGDEYKVVILKEFDYLIIVIIEK